MVRILISLTVPRTGERTSVAGHLVLVGLELLHHAGLFETLLAQFGRSFRTETQFLFPDPVLGFLLGRLCCGNCNCVISSSDFRS